MSGRMRFIHCCASDLRPTNTMICIRRVKKWWNRRSLKGQCKPVSLGLSEPIALVMAKGLGKKLKAGVALTDPVLAPVSGGQVLGTLTVTLNDDELLSRPLVALQDVEAGSWMTRLSDTVRLWFH